MTPDEFGRRLAAIEAEADAEYASALARVASRPANGGRYWHLGGVIAALRAAPARERITIAMRERVEALEAEFYATAEESE